MEYSKSILRLLNAIVEDDMIDVQNEVENIWALIHERFPITDEDAEVIEAVRDEMEDILEEDI